MNPDFSAFPWIGISGRNVTINPQIGDGSLKGGVSGLSFVVTSTLLDDFYYGTGDPSFVGVGDFTLTITMNDPCAGGVTINEPIVWTKTTDILLEDWTTE